MIATLILSAVLSALAGPPAPSPTDVGGGIPTVTAAVNDVGGGIPTK